MARPYYASGGAPFAVDRREEGSMRPWWDSVWLWSGVSIVTAAVVLAIIAIVLIAIAARHYSKS
jgi:hypothetical protein